MTWGERIDVRLHAKDSAAKECMEIVRALANERDELQAQVAVLSGALERLTETIDDQIPLGGYCEEIGLNIDVMLEPWASLFDAKEKADAALLLTPAEAVERVQKLAELLQDAVSETENGERLSKGFCSAAKAAIAEWRRDKCSL